MLKSLVSLLIGATVFLASPALAHSKCEPRLNIDHSVPQGILSHGEHWIDLILAQGSQSEKRHLAAFDDIANDLFESLAAGELETVNEKIDGSPSIVFGWTADGTPFVAYKNHFSANKKQKLVTDASSALEVFPRSEALKKIFSELYQTFTPLMRDKGDLQSYIFQGDLLFVAEDDRRIIGEDGILIKANTVEYRVAPHDENFHALSEARVGIAIHSVGLREVSADGRLLVTPLPGSILNHRPLLERFVAEMTHQTAFVVHPLLDKRPLAKPVSPRELSLARQLLSRIHERMAAIPDSYRTLSVRLFESELRIFFNSQVRPPNDGGIFKQIANGISVSPEDVVQSFTKWLSLRNDQRAAEALREISEENRAGLLAVIDAYLYAIELQYLILPHLGPVMRSKIGGGPVEGLILTTDTAIVKFVDRLEFTLRNNQKRPTVTSFASLPYPLNEWRPGANFVLMKGQPIHAGHVEMVKLAEERFGAVIVLASKKAPNLAATEIKELQAAPTLKKYSAREYIHVFSGELREMILKSAFKGTQISWAQINTLDLWSYLAVARDLGLPGKVRLIVGQKEIDEGRYNDQVAQFPDHLELVALPLQEDGLSATQIRQLIKESALGSKESRRKLDRHYQFVGSDWKRTQIVRALLREWKALDQKAQQLLQKKVRRSFSLNGA